MSEKVENVCLCGCLYVYLTLFHGRSVFVTHGADFHPTLSLFIALSEEFLHNTLSPLPVHCQRLGWVTKVSTVHHVPHDLHTHIQYTLVTK